MKRNKLTIIIIVIFILLSIGVFFCSHFYFVELHNFGESHAILENAVVHNKESQENLVNLKKELTNEIE